MTEETKLDDLTRDERSRIDEYNLGWMAGKDAADEEFESTGTIRISGDTMSTAIKRQLKGLWTIFRTEESIDEG